MPWAKAINLLNHFNKPVFLILMFSVVFFITRVPRLYDDTINPDGVNWHYRSEQFIVGLKAGDFLKTYQHYHPGVMLMWMTGVPIELLKHTNSFYASYNQFNFQTFDFIAKFALVLSQFVLSCLILFLLTKIFTKNKLFPLCVVVLYSLEPFFVGNSRMYHMDAIFTLFVFIALLTLYLAVTSGKWYYFLLSALFMAFSFLTKSIGIGVFVYGVGIGILLGILAANKKQYFKKLALVVLGFVGFTVIFFPALWVKPIYVIQDIFSEGERIGIRNGHGQIILGDYTRDAGPWFYPLIFSLKTTPFMVIGVIAAALFNLRRIRNAFKVSVLKEPIIFLLIFYIGYLLVMTFPSKKIDRYFVPVYPMMAVLCTYSIYKIKDIFKNTKLFWCGLVLASVLFILVPLITSFPYYFLYTSPAFGSSANADKLLAQKPFGIGIYDLKKHIVARYSKVSADDIAKAPDIKAKEKLTKDYPNLGFIDTKPMKTIYPNSKVFDIREYGPGNYDLLVLGINEEMSEEILNSKYVFKLDSTLTIHGLGYWRIYVKEAK